MMDETEMRAKLEETHAANFGWAMSCCAHQRAEAEDVLQTVYLKILQGRARFDGRSSFKTWVFAVIRHTAADERRRQWFRRFGLARFFQEHEQQPAITGHDRLLEQTESRRAVQTAIGQLPRRQREVLHLVFYQDLSVQAAAEIMGVSVGSARTHYERGKQRLRSWLTTAGYRHAN